MIEIDVKIKINDNQATMGLSMAGTFGSRDEGILATMYLALLDLIQSDRLSQMISDESKDEYLAACGKAQKMITQGIEDTDLMERFFGIKGSDNGPEV